MKRLLFASVVFILFGCAPRQSAQSVDSSLAKPAALPDLGPAPELTNETWLNAASPLRLTDLRGSVVAIDMWTFG